MNLKERRGERYIEGFGGMKAEGEMMELYYNLRRYKNYF